MATGADVPVCIEAKARIMSGVGDQLSAPIELPRLHAVLVYPGVPVATALVFARYQAAIGGRREAPYAVNEIPRERDGLLHFIGQEGNDLSRVARSIAPVIAAAEEALDESGAELVRMSGSGSGVWGLFDDESEAQRAAEDIHTRHPGWWTMATKLS
jgi:4-diphosphocytidyl-2-C-methyl-D-erythritol kinase